MLEPSAVRTVRTMLCALPRILTLRLLPVLSLSASSPPGPILLLRDFCEGLSPIIFLLLLPPIIEPRSVVMFSLLIAFADGTAPSDLRERCFAAGSVISPRKAIVAGLSAIDFRFLLLQLLLVMKAVAIHSSLGVYLLLTSAARDSGTCQQRDATCLI